MSRGGNVLVRKINLTTIIGFVVGSPAPLSTYQCISLNSFRLNCLPLDVKVLQYVYSAALSDRDLSIIHLCSGIILLYMCICWTGISYFMNNHLV